MKHYIMAHTSVEVKGKNSLVILYIMHDQNVMSKAHDFLKTGEIAMSRRLTHLAQGLPWFSLLFPLPNQSRLYTVEACRLNPYMD